MRVELDDTAEAPVALSTTAAGPRRAEASNALAPGQQLGHFRIERKLGAGGMGEVYLGTDLALDRPVALKVLPDATTRDPVRRDRLIREARAQARVTHPNVGHIYFIGEDTGRLYFAMEYVAGATLGEKLAAGPLTVDDALAVVRAAALGLREAHRSGITHRDVKPSNLMIDGHGVVKVLDFGLAAGDPAVATAGPVAQTSLAGTPLYMAPEQARGEPIDFRADIYALGATLFHLVSGRPPFVADSVDQLLSLHASAERPTLPRAGKSRTVVAAIDALCSRMMAPVAADRFASYDELIRALELASTAHTHPAGFWVRTMAVGVDYMFVTILCALVIQLGVVLATGSDRDVPTGVISLPLFWLYQTACIARWGRTAGKALFELEVVELDTGRRPGWRRAAIRAAVITGIPILASWAGGLFELIELELVHKIAGWVLVLACLACVIVLIHAAARVPGKRAPWDRIAATMVRYRTRQRTGVTATMIACVCSGF
jgi:uncharacterized RDD family membrane protein YckC